MRLHSLYCLPNLVRAIKSEGLRWAGHVARMEEGRTAFKLSTDKPIEKGPLGRLRRRWKDNVRMDFKELSVHSRNWIVSAQNRVCWRALVNAALNIRFP